MSDQLKKFVTTHRQEFDSIDPPKDLWEKIDAGMSKKNTAGGSKYLSMFIYCGFGLSILALTVYLDRSSGGGSQSAPPPIIAVNSASNTKAEDQLIQNKNNLFVEKPATPSQKEQNKELVQEMVIMPDTTAVSSLQLEEGEKLEEMTEEQFLEAEEEAETEEEVIEKKEPVSIRSKRLGVYIPEDPELKNTYTATLYDASSICAMIRAYKFPGKVENSRFKNSKGNGNFGTGAKLKTVSCSNLQRRTSMNGVWLKGLAGKKLKLSLKSGFKNVFLINRNGEKITPIAISHYFKGLNVITYVGKNLDLVYKDKVELLLFFKKVEVGDKIMIDGKVQTLVKDQPLR